MKEYKIDLRPTEEECTSLCVINAYNELKAYTGIAYFMYVLGKLVEQAKGTDHSALFKYSLRVLSEVTLGYLDDKAFID